MEQPRKRRRVFVTAGLTASAAVLAMSVQAAAQAEGEGLASSYGDTPADTSGSSGFGDPEPDDDA